MKIRSCRLTDNDIYYTLLILPESSLCAFLSLIQYITVLHAYDPVGFLRKVIIMGYHK